MLPEPPVIGLGGKKSFSARLAQVAQYQQTLLVSFEDVESALTAYAREQIRRQSLAQSVQANQRALDLAEDLYRQGLTDFIRVLVSQRGVYLAQDALVQSDQYVSLDLVALYKALGGGRRRFPCIVSSIKLATSNSFNLPFMFLATTYKSKRLLHLSFVRHVT